VQRWRKRPALLALPVLLVLFAAMAYAIGEAVFAPVPAPEEPGFVDAILGSRAVVAAIRVAIIFAAAFVVLSVVALAAKGQWLVRVGPVQVSEGLSDLRSENQRLDERLANADEAIADLERELSEMNCLLYRGLNDSGGAE
jgi:uncharacterized protein YlxW (UPF0749 family)